MSTLRQALRALQARGYTHVRTPQVDGDDDYVTDIPGAIRRVRDVGAAYDESFVLVGNTIVRPWGDEGMADVWWEAVQAAPPASRPTVWDRLLLAEEKP
jgi:hypothetical protein